MGFKDFAFNLFKSKTGKNSVQPSVADKNPMAHFENPLAFVAATEFKDKPFSLSYEVLRQMATRDAVIGSIITTRINQVSSFTQPARFNEDGIGFKIKLRDPEQTPSHTQKQAMMALEQFLENCGWNKDLSKDGFDTFIRKIVRDSLTYDQCTFEIVPDRKGRPAEIIAVDAATIRAASDSYKAEPGSHFTDDTEHAKFVQVLNGQVVSAFAANELAFGVRNPRTNVDLQPYGFGELEQIIHQITSHLFAEEYNGRYFSQGGTTKGILNIKGDGNTMERSAFESFKRQWKAQVSGLYGAWKTPILQAPGGLEYINVSQSNREMEFEKWMNYLINISCAVYQIDPAEVNFPNNGGVGGGHSVFEGSNAEKFQNSKDKGLRPLLRFLETMINRYIIHQFSEEFVFCFTGYNSKSESDIVDLNTKEVNAFKTVNEVRKDHGLEPLEGGDILLNGVYVQMKTQEQQMLQQQEQMALQQEQMNSMNNAAPEEQGAEQETGDDTGGEDVAQEPLETTEKSVEVITIEV